MDGLCIALVGLVGLDQASPSIEIDRGRNPANYNIYENKDKMRLINK